MGFSAIVSALLHDFVKQHMAEDRIQSFIEDQIDC
jgi:hypothetical protein